MEGSGKGTQYFIPSIYERIGFFRLFISFIGSMLRNSECYAGRFQVFTPSYRYIMYIKLNVDTNPITFPRHK